MASLVRICLAVLLFFPYQLLFSQTYIVNGSAAQNTCNCYTLTNESSTFQSGSVWNKTKMDLTQPFDFKFNVFLGCGDSPGADGMAFILQTQPSSLGLNGSGLGFANVSPSIGIALDTYQNDFSPDPNNNLADPSYDHISIQANGVARHGDDLANPVPASATSSNIEDCRWHVLRITWNPDSKYLQTFFDGVFRLGAKVDLIHAIFGSATSVYWGFSAATGGEMNVQKFCTALNPDFSTNLTNDGACIGTPVSFTNRSLSFAPITGYYWLFGDGASSTEAVPPVHSYTAPGVYPVRLAITGLDGCKSDTLEKIITIGSVPKAAFTVTDACFEKTPQLTFSNTNFGTSYQWLVDGTEVSTEEQPQLTGIAVGTHAVQRRVISDFGCGTDEQTQALTIKPAPLIQSAGTAAVCVNVPTQFAATQQDNNTTIQEWAWLFGDGQKAFSQNPMHAFKRPGDYTAAVWAVAGNGCSSDTASVAVSVHEAHADAGRDTIVLNSVPFTLNGSGDGTVKWYPSTGLNRDDILAPVGSLTTGQQYALTITTAEGCVAKDSVKIDVFNGSAVYVPTAFTPDGNGRNDVLKPQYTGIKKVFYFTIYNRWGRPVFSTADPGRGWDGTQNGKALGTGSFVWMLRAEDVVGQVYQLKGTFVLIR